MFSYLSGAKLAAQFVAGLGVSKIVADIVKNNANVVTTADAVKVWTGSVVLGSMIVEQSSNHIERVTKDVTTWLENRKAEKNKETEQ